MVGKYCECVVDVVVVRVGFWFGEGFDIFGEVGVFYDVVLIGLCCVVVEGFIEVVWFVVVFGCGGDLVLWFG